MVEPAGADGTVEVHEVGVGERPPSGHAALARPSDGLLAVRSAQQRRPPRFWTVAGQQRRADIMRKRSDEAHLPA